MAKNTLVGREPAAQIGRRARVIRCHRGLIENLANAVGCSVTDLTGQPYLPVDRATADTLAVVPGIREAIYATRLDDPLELPARPLAELTRWAQQAQEHHDLALSVGRREHDAANRLGNPVAVGLARFGWACKWVNVGARPQVIKANGLALADLGAAEMLGMHHLLAA